MNRFEKLTPEQFASLEPTVISSKPIPRAAVLSGSIVDLATVAANALPVLDSRLKEDDKADELSSLVDTLWEGEEILPGTGQFSVRLLRQGATEDGIYFGELHIAIRLGGPALMGLIHKALEASVEQPYSSEY